MCASLASVFSLADAEGHALALYQAVGADPSDPPGAHALAAALLGPDSVRYGGRFVGDAKLEPHGKKWIVRVRRRLPPVREAWAIAHELAEWALRWRHDEDAERSADLLAACLLMPRAAVLEAVAVVGRDFSALAAAFVVTETAVALRLAEIDDTPTLVVSEHRAWVRGAEYNWPQTLEGARRLAMRTPPDGVRLERERLRDDPRRIVIRGRT